MNFYNLQSFTPIRIEDLIDLFMHNKTIKRGGLFIFGDSMGKPGDTIYTLKNVSSLSNTVSFEFRGNEKIIIHRPLNIYVNEMVIGADMCEKLEWVGENFHFQYYLKDGEINTKVINGTHNFRRNLEGPAFLFYAW